ncbi:MAG: RNA polymerase factor sigma-54 [Gammaproteobacteria bacterium]
MKPTLSIQIGHQLTMTPQLQHAIKLLQLSALELQAEIETYIETNPLLERQEDTEQSDLAEIEAAFMAQSLSKPSQTLDSDTALDILQQRTTEPSLREHLTSQWNLTPVSETERVVGDLIIDAINENGYLETTLEEICLTLQSQFKIKVNEVHEVLLKVQKLDPIGVGARDLKETLMLQLRNLPATTPWRKQAIELVSLYLPVLGRRDYSALKRRLQVTLDELKQVIHLIQTLHPRPGSVIGKQESDYIVPDVFAVKQHRHWSVFLNPNNMPKLRINPEYINIAQRSSSSREHTFLKNHLQEAKWFLKSLEARNDTLIKVSQCIVDKQQGFLEHGDIAMKPLILQDIANEIGMHESTVSRITTQKFIHTPRGIYELKYFFSSHLETASGNDCSSRAIQALIKQFIDHENKTKPLSDHQLAVLLTEQGIKVARRTIAKYREAMAILPSNERKQIL